MKKTLLFILSVIAFNTAIAQPVSLTLEKCRELALQHSETIRQADNDKLAAELDKKNALFSYFPRISANGVGGYVSNIEMIGMEMQMRGIYMAGISLTQPIFTGGQIITGNQLAKVGVQAAEEQLRMKRAQVITDTDRAYWTYIAVASKVDMINAYCNQLDTIYHQIERAVNVGMATENDLLRVDAKRSELSYQKLKVNNGLDLCRMALCNYIGLPFDTQIEVNQADLEGQNNNSYNGARRPELNLLESKILADSLQIRMVRAKMLPTIAFSAGYTRIGNIKVNMNTSFNVMGLDFPIQMSDKVKFGMGSAMLAINIPILAWGENFRNIKKARLTLQNSHIEKEKVENLLNLELQQAQKNLFDASAMVATAELALRQAQENMRITRNRYENGVATLTDLLSAEAECRQAESNLIEARTQRRIYETDFARVNGAL